MNDQEEIQILQQELDQLKSQFQLQYHKILELQQKINRLNGVEFKPRVAANDPDWSLENFIGLKLIHFIGIIVLVIGLSIGVKYAIDRELISEGMRIGLAYAAGMTLYGLSLKLKAKYHVFSAILLSGGMASLYFTTYGAHVYYQMFSFAPAFLLMILLTVYTVYESIRYNRQEIALLGLIGGYAIPFLISQNSERADLFFLYISLINLGVVFVCIRKKWKTIGSVAQGITWLLFLGWAATGFNEDRQWVGWVFMIFFFLIFHFSILAFKLIYRKPLGVNDTYGLLLNNVALYLAALFVFGLSLNTDDHLALISFIFSIFTALQAFIMIKTWKEESVTIKLLSLLSLSLFVFFIALNWDGFTVTFLWLLTAILIFAWGFRIRSVQARMTAILLIGLTLGKLLVVDSLSFTTIQKVIAYLVLGVLLLVVSFFYQKFKQQIFGEK